MTLRTGQRPIHYAATSSHYVRPGFPFRAGERSGIRVSAITPGRVILIRPAIAVWACYRLTVAGRAVAPVRFVLVSGCLAVRLGNGRGLRVVTRGSVLPLAWNLRDSIDFIFGLKAALPRQDMSASGKVVVVHGAGFRFAKDSRRTYADLVRNPNTSVGGRRPRQA